MVHQDRNGICCIYCNSPYSIYSIYSFYNNGK